MKQRKTFNLILLTIVVLAIGFGIWRFGFSQTNKLKTCEEHIDNDFDLLCDVCNSQLPFSSYVVSKNVTANISGENSLVISGYMPKTSKANVAKIEQDLAITTAKKYKKDILDEDIVSGFEISLEDIKGKYQPAEYGQKVDVEISNLDLDENENYAMLHIIDDNNYEILSVKKTSNNSISFTTGSFSTYILIKVGTQTVIFKGESFTILDENGKEISNDANIASGTNFTFKIKPKNGYCISSIACNVPDVLTSQGDEKGMTGYLSSVDEDIIITVSAEKTVSITSQPESVKVSKGSSATFSIVSDEATSYEWQYRENRNNTWKDVTSDIATGYTSANLVITNASENMSGYEFKCLASISGAKMSESDIAIISVASDASIQVYVASPKITKQPESQKVQEGSTATFSVNAEGVDTYKWQYQLNQTTSWQDVTDSISSTYNSVNLVIDTSKESSQIFSNGALFRCIVSSSNMANSEIISDSAALSIAQGVTKISVDTGLEEEEFKSASVTIAGVPMVNKTLGAAVSVDPEDCNLKYNWYASDTQTMSGGTLIYTSTTDNTYVVSSSLLDKYIYVEVEASKTGYTTTTFKNVTGIRVREDDGSIDIMEAIRYVIVDDVVPILTNESLSDVYTNGYILGNSTITQRRKDIATINIKDTLVPTSDAIAAWDVSLNEDGGVIAWLTQNADNPSMCDLNIGGKKKVIASSGYYLFAMYPNLTAINGFDIFDTSQVIYMQSMFEGSEKLTTLDLTNFDTSNVEDMSYMFLGCTSLNNLDIFDWDTSKVTNMKSMFEKCKGFTSLKVSDLNTSSVTNMTNMFRDCTNITNINLDSFDTANVTSMNHMFDGCTSLSNIRIVINTANARNMNSMFKNCTSLITLDLSSFNTGLVTDFEYMFNSCTKLEKIDLSNFNTYSAVSMSGMFKDCISLASLDLRAFDTTNLLTMDEMFANDSKLVSMIIGNNFKVINGNNAFTNCEILRAIITTKSIISPDDALKLSSGITGLDSLTNAILYVPDITSEANYELATNYDVVFGADRIKPILELVGEEKIYVKKGEPYVDEGVTVAGFNSNEAINYMQYDYKLVTVGVPANTLTNGTHTVTYTLSDKDNKTVMSLKRIVYIIDGAILMEREDTGYAIGAKRANKLTYTSDKIRNIYIVNLKEKDAPTEYVDSWDASSAQNESVMVYAVNNSWDTGRYDLYICGIDEVAAPENSKELFANYTNCSSISGFDALNTSNVKNMKGMFKNNLIVSSLDLSSFVTSNVTDMSEMFRNVKAVESLDLRAFSTLNVLDMSGMFNGMEALKTLDISTFNTSNVTNMASMFKDCQLLVTIDVSGFDTSNSESFFAMFENCNEVTMLDVDEFNTSKAKDFSCMFKNCNTITGLDLTNWNTSNAENMSSMFSGCTSIKRLNLDSFDITKITEAQDIMCMFKDCSNLESILLGTKFNSLNGSNMFGNCEKLEIIIARSSEPATLTTDTGLDNSGKVVLYVPNKTAEENYEAITNYINVFGAEKIRPIFELVGEETIELERTDAYTENGASVAGWDKTEKAQYVWYGYDADNMTITQNGNVVSSIDTMSIGEYEITYTLKFTDSNNNMSTIDTLKRIVRIIATDINSENITVTIPDEERIYNGKEHTPEVTIKEKNGNTEDVLILNKDYTVSYANNIEAGVATITIKGIGKFGGSRTLDFEISKRPITIKLDDVTKPYDGKPLESDKFTLTAGTLVEGDNILITVEGSQTVVGSSDNVIVSYVVKNTSENDVTKNYNVTLENGTLTVTKAEQDISFDIDTSSKIVIVKGNTYTFNYSYNGDSEIVGITNNENIATITKNGNAFNIFGVEVGSCKATITLLESANWKEKKFEIEVEVIDAYYAVINGSKTSYHNKLEDAIKENGTIKVLKDVKDTSTNVNVTKYIKLDLDKYEISLDVPIIIDDAGKLIISATSGSAINVNSEIAITNKGTLIIGDANNEIRNAPKIGGNKYAINGKFTFNDGVLVGGNKPPYTGGTVTIERVYCEIITEQKNGMYESRLAKETNPPEIIIIPDITEKTNKNVTLTVIVTDSQSGVKNATYTVNGKTYNLNINSNGEGNIVVTENNKYVITAEDNFGNVSTEEYVVSNIDKDEGNVTNVEIDGETADNVAVIFKNIKVDSDDITEILFSNSNSTVTDKDENWIPYYEDMEVPYVLDGSTGNGVKTIYAWAKDDAGNISDKPYVFKITLKTKLIGGTANAVEFTIAGYDKNYKNSNLSTANITFTASGKDIAPTAKNLEKATSGYANGTITGDKFILTIKNIKGVGKISINISANTLFDKAGNTNDSAVIDTDIYVDTMAPKITIESGRIIAKDDEGNLLGVTVNGKLVRKSEGDCGPATKGDVIKAYDKAGNVTKYIVE